MPKQPPSLPSTTTAAVLTGRAVLPGAGECGQQAVHRQAEFLENQRGVPIPHLWPPPFLNASTSDRFEDPCSGRKFWVAKLCRRTLAGTTRLSQVVFKSGIPERRPFIASRPWPAPPAATDPPRNSGHSALARRSAVPVLSERMVCSLPRLSQCFTDCGTAGRSLDSFGLEATMIEVGVASRGRRDRRSPAH